VTDPKRNGEFSSGAFGENSTGIDTRVLQPRIPINHPFVEVPRVERRIGQHDCSETDDNVLNRIARPLAEQFLVSPVAMRIRLEKLGLLHREVPYQHIFAGGA
jgi:hypothetical protein